ncbi:F0F1 ATP synthase subunit B [Zongyangia hominis]|uniref:ATP synthase subunit b n=1 Tax=Zongyangia hominis TaxID=2763677 RepID=A0A926E8I0_9FIRM|nr:F0F1 ATP synthase subunit B [Zongyangia hominis]MBC8569840.1 F0F1 ATP synthase subunit B [Zongyangia hominis]
MEHESFISLGVWQMINTWINLFILYLLVKKFLFKPVNKILEQRKAAADSLIDDAQKDRDEAAEIKETYTAQMRQAKLEAGEIVKDASQKAEKKADAIVDAAKKQAGDLIERAQRDAEREKKKAINEAKNEISDIALQIASKVIEKEMSEEDHEKLMEQFIDNVGDESWQK